MKNTTKNTKNTTVVSSKKNKDEAVNHVVSAAFTLGEAVEKLAAKGQLPKGLTMQAKLFTMAKKNCQAAHGVDDNV